MDSPHFGNADVVKRNLTLLCPDELNEYVHPYLPCLHGIEVTNTSSTKAALFLSLTSPYVHFNYGFEGRLSVFP